MKICPTCERCYEDAETTCRVDAASLVSSRQGSCIIGEKYRLDRRIGRGGMGAVYAGTHLELDRSVAIKLLLPDYITDANALERFRREARAAARLNHQNVADVYDYGLLTDGGAYIVMELIEGETLREHMNKDCTLPFGEAASIARQVAEGIDAAHRNHIIHRDLKPSNIILMRDHQNQLVAKVVDFGIAKLKEATVTGDGALTNTGMLIGTPRYMSPEQCGGQELDARSDIYTVGVLLYEMLGCRAPFDAPSATAIALKHIQELPAPLTNFRSDLPPALAAIVMQALEKDPAKRQQTAAELARQLRDAESQITDATPQTQVASAAATTLLNDDYPLLLENESAPSTHNVTNQLTDPHSAEPVTNRSGVPTVEEPLDINGEASAFAHPAQKSSDGEGVATPFSNLHLPRASTTSAHTASSPPVPFADAPRVPASNPKREKYLLGVGLLLALFFGSIALVFFLRDPQNAQDTSGDDSTPSTASSRNSSGRIPPPDDARTAATSSRNEADSASNSSSQDAAALRSSLTAWVNANNERDINRQMSFYTPTTARYYTQQNASQAFVRADKIRSIGNASSVDMRVRDTQIDVAPNGRTATMRFTKQYAITRNGNTARGEVLSELGWLKTEDGWKIVSERDLRVIS
ncbi:MAG: protein kinase [Pyrinomonadaceae bacterium]|nr:protein kinase [Pyrinomonadaceae bacterium]